METKRILFLHGYTSGGNCETVNLLRTALKDSATIVAPDLSPHPVKAISTVKTTCEAEHPDLIVAISCGCFYAQQVVADLNVPALLINPHFGMSSFLSTKLGVLKYISPRVNGETEINVTPELVAEFAQMEPHQFDHYQPQLRNRVWGLFGLQDQVAHFRPVFEKYFSTVREFDGGHAIEPNNVIDHLVPMIQEMLQKVVD